MVGRGCPGVSVPGGGGRAVRVRRRQRTQTGRAGVRRGGPGPGGAERAGTARNTPARLAGADPRGKSRNGAGLWSGPGGADPEEMEVRARAAAEVGDAAQGPAARWAILHV